MKNPEITLSSPMIFEGDGLIEYSKENSKEVFDKCTEVYVKP